MKLISSIVAIYLAFSGAFGARFTENIKVFGQSGIQMTRSDSQGVELEFSSPPYQLHDQWVGGIKYHLIEMPQAFQSSVPDLPQMPFYSVMIGVPPDATIVLNIKDQQGMTIGSGYELPPAPTLKNIQEELSPGEYQLRPEASSPWKWSDQLFPESPVRLVEDAWLRYQRIIRLEIYPFQYRPANGELIRFSHITAEISFKTSGAEFQSIDGIPGINNPLYEPLYRANLINYEAARDWRSLPKQNLGAVAVGLTSAHDAAQSASSENPKYRIEINQNGLYKLTHATLNAAGVPLTGNLDEFQILNQGRQVAIHVQDQNGNNQFDQGDYLLFYGDQFDGEYLASQYPSEDDQWISFSAQDTQGNTVSWQPAFNAKMLEKYTNQNIYWLIVGEGQGLLMDVRSGIPGSAPIPTSFRETVHAEHSAKWKTTLFAGEDTWFWEEIYSSANPGETVSRSYPINLPAPLSSGDLATLRGEIVGGRYNYYASPDHRIQVYLNDPAHTNPLLPPGTGTWDGISRYLFEVQVPQSQLLAGQNILDLVIYKTDALYQDVLYFDWFEIEYQREFQAENNLISFSDENGGAWRYQIDNFNGINGGDLHVLDITDPLHPIILWGATLVGGQAEFEDTQPDGTNYFVGVGLELPLGAISIYTPVDLSQPAQYVFITHQDLINTTQTLADYRAQQGLSTAVIDFQDLINEFNYGIYHPIAIKNFLASTLTAWGDLPDYVLLVGDGHWNLKGDAGYDAPPVYMPPNLAWVDPWQGEVDSANLLATVVGVDPLPDLMIARLPVNSPQELQVVINKIMAYEAALPEDLGQSFLFVDDNTPDGAGDFVALSEGIIRDYLPEGSAQREYLDFYSDQSKCQAPPEDPGSCPAATQGIIQQLNQTGATLVNYIGHASLNYWTNEKIFANEDIPLLTNSQRLPVLLSMTCLDGYWIHPNLGVGSKSGPSLVEELLRADQAGVVAAFSPTGLGVASGHDQLQRGFYDALFLDDVWELGIAAMTAKVRLYQAGYNFDLLHTFTVFGDPALVINKPIYSYRTHLPIVDR